jgi:trigger factor
VPRRFTIVKSAVETLSPTRVRLTVEVPFEELKPNLDAAYKEIAKQVTIPGFRKGKIPPPIIDQRVGRNFVLDQAINDALPGLYSNAVQESQVEPVGQPEVKLDDAFVDGGEFKFTAEVDVRPEITLPDYTGIEASVDAYEVTESEVDEQVESLRERFGSLQTVERPAQDGDHVSIDLSASKGGELVENAQLTGYSYKLAGSSELVEGLDDVLRGKQAGDTATFVSKLPAGDLADEEVDITVTVQSVKEQQLPDLDDEFAQLATEFDTLEEVRADLRERVERSKRIEQAREARDAVLLKLLESVDVPLPEAALAQDIEQRRDNLRHQLSHAGLTEEQYLAAEGQTEEEYAADLDKRARDAMKAEFVLDELGKKEELSVSEDDLTRQIVMRAQQVGVSPNEYADLAMKQGMVPGLVREVVRNKALNLVIDSANVTDSNGQRIEIKWLRPDGTIVPEEERDTDEPETPSEES